MFYQLCCFCSQMETGEIDIDNEKFMKRLMAKKKRDFSWGKRGSIGKARGRRKGIYRKQTFAVLELTKLCTTCIKQSEGSHAWA